MASTASLPRRGRVEFHGWWMVPIALVGFMATLPGQSVGVAAFNESLRRDLQLSASQLSGLYALGTILAACLLPLTGAAMDRFGIRRIMALVVVGLSLSCVWMGTVRTSWALLLAFFGLRFLGQGSLSLLSNSTLAMWFHRRLGTVAGASSLVVTLGMGLAPLLLKEMIEAIGWRATYQWMGFAVAICLLPPLALWYRNRPEDIGQWPDGDIQSGPATAEDTKSDSIEGCTWGQAFSTRAYWILLFISVSWSLIGTGLIFNVQPLFGEKQVSLGSPELAISCFFTAVAISQLISGFLVDRWPAHRLLLLATLGMVLSLLLLWSGEELWFFAAYALYGVVQGVIAAVGSTVYVRYFGRRHLGKIKSGAMVAMVAGSSAGPLAMSLFKDGGMTYNISLLMFAGIALLNVGSVAFLRPPRRITAG